MEERETKRDRKSEIQTERRKRDREVIIKTRVRESVVRSQTNKDKNRRTYPHTHSPPQS